MIGTVVVTAVYRDTTSLGNAYGVCVMFVTFFDTCMVALAALIVWRFPPYFVVLPWLAIASMDGAFLSSALIKVPHGAWFTLALSAVLASIFILWRYGKENQWAAEKEDRLPLAKFVDKDENGTIRLTAHNAQQNGEALSITKGFGIFFDKGGINTPMVFSQFIGKLVSVPEVIVFFHMRPLEYPTVPAGERFIVSQVKSLPNCYRVICRHGFMDAIVTPDLASVIYEHVCHFVLVKSRPVSRATVRDFSPGSSSGEGSSAPKTGKNSTAGYNETELTEYPERAKITELRQAYDHRVLYIVGKEEMFVKPKTSILRAILLRTFLFLRDNTRSKMSNLKVPTDRLVEIGFVKAV